MKTVFNTILLILFSIHLHAQEFSIKSIEKLPTDMDARVNYARKDQNGKTCAIIKISTPLTGFSFDTGTLSVQYVVEKTGEIWVYVQPGIKKITIAHQSLGVVREWNIPIIIEEACAYALTLNTLNKNHENNRVENPKRRILLTLKQHELIYSFESLLSFNKSGSHYACLATDTLLGKDYLIVDGIKKIVANRIVTNYIDAASFEKSVFCYRDGEKMWNFYIEGVTYGPYVGEKGEAFGDLYCSDQSWILNGVYAIKRGNEWYYYFRGEPWSLTDYPPFIYRKSHKEFKGDTIQSVNRKYKVYCNEFGTITYNGKKYRILQNKTFDSDWYQGIGILDDGRCILEYKRTGHPIRQFVFSEGQIQEIAQGQFFNYKTCSVDDSNEKYGIFNRRLLPWLTDYDMKKKRILVDSSNTHSFETCPLYPYVLIDNKEYGHACAFYELYNEEINEFQWIALEGSELVMYRYCL